MHPVQLTAFHNVHYGKHQADPTHADNQHKQTLTGCRLKTEGVAGILVASLISSHLLVNIRVLHSFYINSLLLGVSFLGRDADSPVAGRYNMCIHDCSP